MSYLKNKDEVIQLRRIAGLNDDIREDPFKYLVAPFFPNAKLAKITDPTYPYNADVENSTITYCKDWALSFVEK